MLVSINSIFTVKMMKLWVKWSHLLILLFHWVEKPSSRWHLFFLPGPEPSDGTDFEAGIHQTYIANITYIYISLNDIWYDIIWILCTYSTTHISHPENQQKSAPIHGFPGCLPSSHWPTGNGTSRSSCVKVQDAVSRCRVVPFEKWLDYN